MCYFDEDPIYTLEGIRPDDCNGEGHNWYYNFLLIIHIYCLIDFILRLLVEKYKVKFLI